MAYTLTNAKIVKGSALQIFIGEATPQGTQGSDAMNFVGFATNHTLSITTNTNELSTKDHGDYPAILPTTITWEVTAENVYAAESNTTLIDYIKNRKLVYLKFVQVANYSTGSGSEYSYNNVEEGIVGTDKAATGWTPGTIIAEGAAYITSYSVNAPAGDNASISCTFTGSGPLKQTA